MASAGAVSHADLGPSATGGSSPMRSTYFGIDVDRRLDQPRRVRGTAHHAETSQRRGIASALRRTVRAGPAMTASIGIVNIARLARVPILPITYATSRRRVLRDLGPLPSCLAVRPRRLFVGRADRDLPRISTRPGSNTPGASSSPAWSRWSARRSAASGTHEPPPLTAAEPAGRRAQSPATDAAPPSIAR